MSDYVLFQMWGPFRQSLIDRHIFYVEQAQKRLLSQFNNIEADADRASEEYLENRSGYFDPDRHDPSDFYEAAHDAGIEFYGLLSDMREQTRLSVVAGLFHEWDKQLRDWLTREIGNWHNGATAAKKIWSADFVMIADLLESLGWKVRSAAYFQTLDACRLVVNVYKHGEGKSLDDLSQNYPDYLVDPLKAHGGELAEILSQNRDLDHTHLKVSDAQIQAFSDAIVTFWRSVPVNTFQSQVIAVPSWFEKAILTDRSAQKQANKT
jgi:hypothetical protein